MTHSADPWMNSKNGDNASVNGFDDNFVSCPSFHTPAITVGLHLDVNIEKVDGVSTSKFLTPQEYSKKLEEKLERLQKRNQPNGKTMLEHLKQSKEFYLGELLQGLDLQDNGVVLERPSFLDRLYSTNGVYRHMNPQQALDSSEKEPFVKHDHLARCVSDVENTDIEESKEDKDE